MISQAGGIILLKYSNTLDVLDVFRLFLLDHFHDFLCHLPHSIQDGLHVTAQLVS